MKKTIGILLILVITVTLLSGCVSGPTEAPSEITPTPTPNPVTSAPIITRKTITPQPGELIFKVGETAADSEIAVTIKSAQVTNQYLRNDDEIQRAPKGKKYVIIDTEIKTIRNGIFISPSDFYVFDDEGNSYWHEGYQAKNPLYSQWIYPGMTSKGKIVFDDIPESAMGFRVHFRIVGPRHSTYFNWKIE